MLGALLRAVDRAAENRHQPFLADGLFEEEERARLSRFDRARDRSLAADHDHFRRRIDFLEPAQELDAVDVGEHEVRDDHVGPPLLVDLFAARADERGPDFVPFRFDDHLQPFGHRRLIVNRQDALAALVIGLTYHASLGPGQVALKDGCHVFKSYTHQ